jgi:DNA repair exonuclease SbcCD ATPase subunit
MNLKSSRGVQQHEVNAAADALIAQGVRPTIERVRAQMGRGSPNTVAPMLDTWFAGLAGRLGLDAGLEEGGPPPPVRHLLGQIWVAAVDAGAQRAETALSNRHSELQADREALAKARQELVAQEAALAEKAIGIDQALALAKRQLDERNVEMNQLRSELGTLHADLTRLRGSLAGVVQERDADRQVFAEQQRAHASERQRIEERAAATERRLLEDIDRSRQDAKVARNALADSQRQQELMRGEVQTLTERNHHAQVEIAALTERLAASNQRESGLSLALQDLRTAANQPAAPANKAGRRAGARKGKV